MSTSSTGTSGAPRAPAPPGLRLRLALAFGALAGALAVALSLVIGRYASEAARVEISRHLTRLAIEYRDKLDTSLAERMDEVAMLARLDVALPDAAAAERRRARIEQLARNRDYAWIGYASPAGRVEVATGRLLEGADVSTRPWFRAARERAALLDAHEAVLLAKLLPPTPEPRRFVDLAVPIAGDKGFAGVVGAHIDFEWARRLRADIEGYSRTEAPFELLLVQGDGTVLIGPPALLGRPVPLPLGARVGAPAAIERWPDGEDYLAGGSASRGIGDGLSLGWVTIARQKRDVAFAPVAELQRAILWAGLALALAGIAAGWLLATRLARPLESLAAAAADVAAGKHRAVLPRPRDYGEVARLSDSLRAMLSHLREQAESLREAQDRMEQRVRERTAELVKLQAQLELEVADTMVARDDVSRAREQLALALEASNLVLWDLDVASDRIYLGATWSRMLGGPAVETRTSSLALLDLVPEEARARVREAVRSVIAGPAETYAMEHPVRRPDGRLIWIASRGRVAGRDADGRALRLVGTNLDITERVAQIDALRESEARFRSLTQMYSDWYWELDADLRFTRIEGEGLAQIGYSPRELIGRSAFDIKEYALVSMSGEEFARLRAQRLPYRDVLGVFRRADGAHVYVSVSGGPVFSAAGAFVGYRGVTRNVTERVRAEQAQREADQRFKLAFEGAAVGMALVAPDGRYLRVNRALCELLGYGEAELLRLDVRALTHPDDLAATEAKVRELLSGADSRFQIEKRYLRKDGSTVWAQLDVALMRDELDLPLQFFAQIQDIGARRAAQSRIEALALQDPLTGLPNKRLLEDRLAQALAEARRAGQSVGLLYIDLDGFKPVNDTLGHAVGDVLLREVARRGRAALRETDTLARAGGDEFVAILPGAGREALRQAAERLLKAISAPYRLEDAAGASTGATISASIGAALSPAGHETPDALLRFADAAMYQAKRGGRNAIRFHAVGGTHDVQKENRT